ncbi:MAG: hypothetical protein IKI93_05985, partial [Clostridia bacterium]|nr:hypothetical protein [Clostridia bacterium]
MTLYTAIGKYEFRRNTAGEKLPHIITSNRDHEPDVWEMLIWSSLLWNILTYEEICHQFYEKERQIHILGDRTCEAYLNQMEQQGL